MSARAYLGRLSALGYGEAIRQGLDYVEFGRLIPSQGRVFIKPNLTFPTYRPGVMTTLAAIEAAIQVVQDYTPHVIVGDADGGGYNRFSMDEVYRETGLCALAGRYGVRVVNLSQEERRSIAFRVRGRHFELALPRLLTDEIDLLLTMPVPKVHANAGVSLALKNQWGCIPEPADRLRLHPYLEHVLIEINRAVNARAVIVDGGYGLTENGPLRGRPVELDWVLVSNDLGAGERVACALMQVPLDGVRHLRYARQMGLIPSLGEIALNQEIGPFLGEKFVLHRAWTDLPGVLAFRSPLLADVAYSSPLAGVLHRLLYLVREPFYDARR